MPSTLPIEKFIKAVDDSVSLVLDTRSPKEYSHAHLPGAINLPLLDDEHRHLVGTTYKKEGREAAVLLGFDLVGPRFGEFIRRVRELTSDRHVFVYCWRGGMRSNIMAWILELSGFRVTLLNGGYKSYRKWVLETFNSYRKLLVVGGRTGSGKTQVLHELEKKGEQVIDLEGLAHHKGSAFGALGQPPQPMFEQFENRLAMKWNRVDPERVCWIENESRTIGQVKIPDAVYDQIRLAPVIELNVPLPLRLKRIMDEYGSFPADELIACTAKLKKRLGGLRLQEALDALENDRRLDWLTILLDYYDATYDYGSKLRATGSVFPLERFDAETTPEYADRLIEFSKRIPVIDGV